ncbi:MAG: diguanylate cyclase [Kangiellaceae bacterium]|nr:diguanylate cyclase [Kangiellaceae bacterium]
MAVISNKKYSWDIKQLRPLLVILVAAIYIVTALVGQQFAISPGNVTPVWLPSGIMVALTLYLGNRIWPGVFLGAFIGNSWAYFSPEFCYNTVAAAFLNGAGDVLSTVLMANLIATRTNTSNPFTKLPHLLWYVLYAVIIGSLISAVFGTVGLTYFGIVPAEKFSTIFSTWAIGDATGALIFGPLVIAWLNKEKFKQQYYNTVFIALVIVTSLITLFIFEILVPVYWITLLSLVLIPAILFTTIYYGQRIVFTLLTTISSIAVYSTSIGKGPFVAYNQELSLLLLQIFIGIFSLVLYVIALITYKQSSDTAVLKLQKNLLEKLYRQDALTGLWNRYRISEQINHELSLFERSGKPFGLILLDIDDFKKINDQYGHLTGDKILKGISSAIHLNIRSSDLLGRWGGEEFLIIIPDTSDENILVLMEKVRESIAATVFDENIRLTVSLGATVSKLNDTETSMTQRADRALYYAKEHGKNQSTIR